MYQNARQWQKWVDKTEFVKVLNKFLTAVDAEEKSIILMYSVLIIIWSMKTQESCFSSASWSDE